MCNKVDNNCREEKRGCEGCYYNKENCITGKQHFERIKKLYKESNKYMLKLDYEDIGILIQIIEIMNNKEERKYVKDVTSKFENMIQAFECDFNLPFNYNDFTMFDDLGRLIKNKNPRLIKDIELLQELSFGIRYGTLKIIKVDK